MHCREVILSGGDPLSLETTCLSEISEATFHLPHIRHLRVHARFPVMIPQRVDDELLAWIAATTGRGLPMTIVLQVNHAAEIDGAVAAACQRMIQAGAMLLCQSVLLRGVNDDEDALSDLLLRLVDIRVLPYYLHQLDRTAGAAHFEVPIQRGRALIAALRERLPGYAIPRYVRELPGGTSKEVLQ